MDGKMTALELADYITVNEIRTVTIDMVANMLRQQQAEIEALKLRELTDEEILEIASPMFVDVRYPSTALEFARAILKKAREK